MKFGQFTRIIKAVRWAIQNIAKVHGRRQICVDFCLVTVKLQKQLPEKYIGKREDRAAWPKTRKLYATESH